MILQPPECQTALAVDAERIEIAIAPDKKKDFMGETIGIGVGVRRATFKHSSWEVKLCG